MRADQAQPRRLLDLRSKVNEGLPCGSLAGSDNSVVGSGPWRRWRGPRAARALIPTSGGRALISRRIPATAPAHQRRPWGQVHPLQGCLPCDLTCRPLGRGASLPKLGRNAPCHCGSGKKYKKCHFGEQRARSTLAARARRRFGSEHDAGGRQSQYALFSHII
jgi:hypothetical protein